MQIAHVEAWTLCLQETTQNEDTQGHLYDKNLSFHIPLAPSRPIILQRKGTAWPIDPIVLLLNKSKHRNIDGQSLSTIFSIFLQRNACLPSSHQSRDLLSGSSSRDRHSHSWDVLCTLTTSSMIPLPPRPSSAFPQNNRGLPRSPILINLVVPTIFLPSGPL